MKFVAPLIRRRQYSPFRISNKFTKSLDFRIYLFSLNNPYAKKNQQKKKRVEEPEETKEERRRNESHSGYWIGNETSIVHYFNSMPVTWSISPSD